MSIKIKFDCNNRAIDPTFVLATRSGKKLGSIPFHGLKLNADLKESSDIFFTINRYSNGKEFRLWDKVKDMKLIHCPEWNTLFEAKVEIEEGDDCTKSVTGTFLGNAELSQILINDLEINTEEDIARPEYEETVLYDSKNSKASLLHKLLEKAPHYKITHVDASISRLQRPYSFNEISILDAFREIEEELKCYFKIDVFMTEDGTIERLISVYDLQMCCSSCGERWENESACPKCGSTIYSTGYGYDTGIFVSSDGLADTITYSTNSDEVKNCFKLTAGDDLMTATIANCNPNGSEYIWHFSEDLKEDMSPELSSKIDEYDSLYSNYYRKYIASIHTRDIDKYNSMVRKYSAYSEELSPIPDEIIGYPSLIETYYHAIDFSLFLKHGLMPNVKMQETSAEQEVRKLTEENIPIVSVTNLESISLSTLNSSVVSLVKTIVDPRYKVNVGESSLGKEYWAGDFILTNYSSEDDTARSEIIRIKIDDDYESFVRQKIDKLLSKNENNEYGISGIFKLSMPEFQLELGKYSLNRLMSFHDACQSCLNLLIEQGVADNKTWGEAGNNLYDNIYVPYYDKLNAIQEEIKIRENEIYVVDGKSDLDGNIIYYGMKTILESEIKHIQSKLNFKNFFGERLWIELSSYRREKPYRNDNYISDGLSNSDLIQNAIDYIDAAKKEIMNASIAKPSISAKLKNLLLIPEFSSLVDNFTLGNWMRLKIGNDTYRLRLTKYGIDFSNLESIDVEFSDVVNNEPVRKSSRFIDKMNSIASKFTNVSKNAKLGKQGQETIHDVVTNGLSVSKTKITDGSENENMSWDGSSGIMLKKYDEDSQDYEGCQLKMHNSTISITDDNWRNVKTAIGEYYYLDPVTNKLKRAYGINAEVLIGKIILGEQLGIYNDSGSMTFDSNGWSVANGINSVVANPNDDVIFAISHKGEPIFYINEEGKIYIKADGQDVSIENNNSVILLNQEIQDAANSIAEEEARAIREEKLLYDSIGQVASDLESEVIRAKGMEASNRYNINVSLEKINELSTKIEIIAQYIKDTHGASLF